MSDPVFSDSKPPIWRGPEQCTAKSTRTGQRCQRAPIKGSTVCPTHGGRAPNVKAAAKRRIAEQKLAAEVVRAATTGELPVLVPGTTLLESVAMMAQVVTFQRHQLAALDKPSMDALDRFMAHVERLGKMAKLADDAELGQRKMQLEEWQLTFVMTVMERVIGRLDELVFAATGKRVLDPMDPVVRELVQSEIQRTDSGAAA